MSCGALHVYYSALPFTPRTTLLFQTYQHELHSSPHVRFGKEEGWSPCLRGIEANVRDAYQALTIVISNDGALIAVADEGTRGRVHILDSTTGTWLVTLVLQSPWFRTTRFLDFSNDGASVIVLGSDDTATIWDSRTGSLLLTIEHCSCIAFSRDGNKLVSICPSKRQFAPCGIQILHGVDGSKFTEERLGHLPNKACTLA
jgi:WD40 repeat protein